MQNRGKLRLGAVAYLNTKPLVHQLGDFAPWAEIVYDVPSRLADGLAAGTLDVALIPSIEYLRDPGYRIVSDACIGCRGPVLSVKLFFRPPPGETRTLALDEGSRTSVALARILLAERFDVHPRTVPLPIGASADDVAADAVLLIGDRAIRSPAGRWAEVWDLGEEWCRWAKLPFVFALWVARPGVEIEGIEEALRSARDAGVAHLDEIARAEGAAVGLTSGECLAYLRDNLHFRLEERERQGLDLFLNHAARLGLAPGPTSEVPALPRPREAVQPRS
jgi:chorismate dehydratase